MMKRRTLGLKARGTKRKKPEVLTAVWAAMKKGLQMFGALRLGVKLGIGFLVPLLFLIVTGAVGLLALHAKERGLESVYQDRVVPLQGLKSIADAYAVNVIDAVNKAQTGIYTAEQALEHVQEASARIRAEWQAYRATTLTPAESWLALEAEQLFRPADQDIARLTEFLRGRSGSLAGQMDEFNGPLYHTIDPISA